jgi:hypothetical protein
MHTRTFANEADDAYVQQGSSASEPEMPDSSDDYVAPSEKGVCVRAHLHI